jgi:hypothetical protein
MAHVGSLRSGPMASVGVVCGVCACRGSSPLEPPCIALHPARLLDLPPAAAAAIPVVGGTGPSTARVTGRETRPIGQVDTLEPPSASVGHDGRVGTREHRG